MKGDIRRKTGVIVQRGNEYLVGTILGTKLLRWSLSPYDAWFTRNRDKARMVAGKVGGDMILFNPIVGQIRRMKGETHET